MNPGRGWIGIALVAVVAGMVHLGLEPYDFRRPNRVRWLDDGAGLRFTPSAFARMGRDWRWRGRGAAAPLGLEIWLTPETLGDGDGGVALGFFDDEETAPLLIAQWKYKMYLRTRVLDEGGGAPGATRDLSFRPIRPPGAEQFLAVSSGPGGTTVYVDGEPSPEGHSEHPLVPARHAIDGRVMLGSALHLDRQWLGSIRALAFYRASLSDADVARHQERVARDGPSVLEDEPGIAGLWTFEGPPQPRVASRVRPAPTIEIPDLFRERAPRFLAFAPGDLRLEPDVALNVVGFAPLGFLLALLLVRSGVGASGAILVAIALGAGLSLGIEWVQVHLPSRVSSATDLAANTLGTALGAALVLRFRGRGAQQQS